jgi:hypothetical protein
MVFGTNTTMGVKVGQDANQTPTVEVGYSRQEAAFVPVLANTGENSEGRLSPCPGVQNEGDGTVTIDIDQCKFQATHDGKDKDAYSTLASFGGKAGTDGKGGNVTVAQYFATGIAAQALAWTGGANVVQAGGDTKAKADGAARAAEAEAEKEKTKAQLRIEAEKDNQKKYESNIEAGTIIAKSILGIEAQAVDVSVGGALEQLVAKINVPACGKTQLQALDVSTVKKFLADMKTKRFQCLARLGIDVKK